MSALDLASRSRCRRSSRLGPTLGVLAAVALAAPVAGRAQETEAPPVFRASQLLPPDELSGPDFRVGERVENDGFMNHYTITTRFGAMTADSNAQMRERVREIHAIAKLETLSSSSQFIEGVGDTGKAVLKGAGDLITNPIGSVSGAIHGVGALFRRGGEAMFGDPASQTESGLPRVAAAKREYAAQLGVDPYSRNPILQKHLDTVARASAAGGLAASVALAFVPGGAGVAITVAKSTEDLGNLAVTAPPSDLRAANREKLTAMGVNPSVVDLFLENTVYSPREQTLLVGALDGMSGTADRGAFVHVAVLTRDGDTAEFRMRQAQMYAGYHRTVAPIARFVAVGELVAARTAAGAVVFNVPVDYLAWTSELVGYVTHAEASGALRDVKEKQLWLTGSVSPLARTNLTQRGWSVVDGAEGRLIGTQ